MTYKLLALDIDGTLLNSNGKVCKSTIEAIKRVKNKAIMVTISTGRPIQGVYKYIDLLGLKAPIITYNGAMIIDSETKEIIYDQQLKEEDSRQIIELGLSYDTTLVIWSNNKLYVNRIDDYITAYQSLSGEQARVVEDYEVLYKAGVTKVIWVNKAETLIRYQDEISAVMNLSISYCTSKPHYLEFFDSHVSKAKALEFIGNRNDISKEEMIAIGDGNNDIEMIEYVGMGVAMENATDRVKDVSNYITTSNDDKGIYNALQKFIK